MSFRCDNVLDCDSGKDEENCFALSDQLLPPKAYGGLNSAGKSQFWVISLKEIDSFIGA
jgi:hypothetical protein